MIRVNGQDTSRRNQLKKYILLFLIALLDTVILSPILVADTFQKNEKMIWIDQLKQVGAAYEGEKGYRVSGDYRRR